MCTERRSGARVCVCWSDSRERCRAAVHGCATLRERVCVCKRAGGERVCVDARAGECLHGGGVCACVCV